MTESATPGVQHASPENSQCAASDDTLQDLTGDDGEPSAKKLRTDPKPNKKLHPILPPKQAAGQEFLRQQLQDLGNTQAVLSARTTQAANGCAIYKQKCAIYHSDVKRQDKHNDRLLQLHKINNENAARAGMPRPKMPELDNRGQPIRSKTLRHLQMWKGQYLSCGGLSPLFCTLYHQICTLLLH